MISIQSPYSAEALVLEVETPFVYSRHTGECRIVSNAEIGRWLISHGEVRRVNVENLTELENSLALYVDSRTALRFALYSADKDLDDALRERAISSLDPLLSEPNVYAWLQDLFCLQALPEDSIEIARSSLNYAKRSSLKHYVSFYNYVLENQPIIRHLSAVWDLIEASSIFENLHRDLMDRALGTGIFKRIVSSGAKPELLDLALLVLLKLCPNVGTNITKKIFYESIINKVVLNYSEILGDEDIVRGIDYFGFWSVPTVERKYFVTMNSPEPPFQIGDHLGQVDLVIASSGDRKFISPILPGLARYLETHIAAKRGVATRYLENDILPDLLGRCDDDGISAMNKVLAWGKAPLTGACQSLRSVFISGAQ